MGDIEARTCLILGQIFCFASAGMVLVTTRVSSTELLILSTALPESTLHRAKKGIQ